MDKIWDRNPLKSEFIGRCGEDEKKRMIRQNQQKSNANYGYHGLWCYKISRANLPHIFLPAFFPSKYI